MLRDPEPQEHLFELAGLGVRPVEDRDLAGVTSGGAVGLDQVAHVPGLVVPVERLEQRDRIALRIFRPQDLRMPVRVVADGGAARRAEGSGWGGSLHPGHYT